MLCRTGLDLEGLQLLLGLEPPEGTLDDDGGIPLPQKPGTCHPAPGILLDDGGFVLLEDLLGRAHTACGFALQGGDRRSFCNSLGLESLPGLGFRRPSICGL